MTIEFNCPHCDKTLRTADDRSGRQAKCPGCGQVVVVPNPGDNLEDRFEFKKPFLDNNRPEGPRPDRGENSDIAFCPVCGESINDSTDCCRHCGESLDSPGKERLPPHRETRPFPPGEVISEAFRIYSERWILLTVAFVPESILTSFLWSIPVSPLGFFPPFINANDDFQVIMVVAIATVGIVLMGLAAVFAIFLHTGLSIICLKILRKQPASLSDLFSGGRFLRRMVINTILFSLMLAVGTSLCFVPALFVAVVFLPFVYVLVDEDRPGIDSLKRAKELTDGNWGSMFLIVLMGLACCCVGALACCIGFFLAVPYVNVLNALAYERMTYQTSIQSLLDQVGEARSSRHS